MPIIEANPDVTDLNCLIQVAPGGSTVAYVANFYLLKGVENVIFCQGMAVPATMIQVAAGNYKEIVPGLTGAAEYELLLGQPGVGLVSTDSISLSHMAMIALVVIGNIGYLMARSEGKEK
jgi:hypothetical protein